MGRRGRSRGLRKYNRVNDGDEEITLVDNICRQRLLLACVLFDFVVISVAYLAVYGFSFPKLYREDIAGYPIGRDVLDVWILMIIRLVLFMILFSRFQWSYTTVKNLVWCSAALLVGKCLIWVDWSGNGVSSGVVVVALLLNLTEGYLLKNCLIPSSSNQDVESGDGKGGEEPNECCKYIKVLFPYFWPSGLKNRLRVAATWVCLIISKGTGIMAPFYIGYAVQKLKSHNQVDYTSIILYAGLAFLAIAFKQLQNIIYLGVKQTAYAEIARNTFGHLHTLSLEWHLKKKIGNVLRAMDRGVNSANTVVTYLFLYLGPSIVEATIVFIIFYFHYRQPALSAIIFLGVIFYSAITIIVTLWRKEFRKKTNKHDNDLHDKATDSLINYETVKYFANEQYEISNFNKSVEEYQKYDVATQASLGLLNSAQQLIIDVTLGSCLIIAAVRVAKGDLNVGDFVSVNAFVIQLYAPLSFLGTIYNAIIQAFVDMANLSDILTLTPDVRDAPNAKPLRLDPSSAVGCRLEFKNVRFKYPSMTGDKGLKGITFTVEPGTTTAIVGPTGAGKSTIGRMLFRFYDVQGGQVLIDGQDISQVTQASLRSAIGVVPQDTVLFNDTIYHNVSYGNLGAPKEAIERACKDASLLEWISQLEEKWDTTVGERGLRLSGGEKQRVAIARALLKDPKLVLLDEATSSLDSKTEASIQSALDRLGKQRTSLVIAHRLSTIMNAHQILVLKAGEIVERGTHEELLTIKDGVYAELWRTQTEMRKRGDEIVKDCKSAEGGALGLGDEKESVAAIANGGHGHGHRHGHDHGRGGSDGKKGGGHGRAHG